MFFIATILTILFLLNSCARTQNSVFLTKDGLVSNIKHIQVTKKFYHENVIGFEKNDQTNLLYMFSSPIYIKNDKDYDIYSNALTPVTNVGKGYTFTNKLNDVKTYLPDTISAENGIRLEINHTKMDIFPLSEKSENAQKTTYTNIYGKNVEHILYKNAFGKNKCHILLDDFGVNTELVINDSEPIILRYIVAIENVKLDTTCPDYVLFRSVKNNEVKGVIYKPVIVEKGESVLSGVTTEKCAMDIIVAGKGLYQVSVKLDKKYMSNVKLPLKINQSFHLYKSKQPDSAIYSNSNAGYYLNDKVILGNDALKGEGELLVRFEALDLLSIDPQNIISAEYTISEISGTSGEATIALYPVLSEWCSLNTRWNTKPAYAKEFVKKTVVSKSGDYSFDITEPLKKWLENRGKEVDYIIRHGFVLVNETPGSPKLFATGDNGIFTSCLKINLKKSEE